MVANADTAVVRLIASHRALGVVQPGANRKPEQIEALSPHVDPQLFLKREGETRSAVIEDDALDLKFLLLEHRCGRERRWREFASAEGLSSTEFADTADAIAVEIGGCQDEVERCCVE